MRAAIGIIAFMAVGYASGVAAQTSYPQKTLRVIVPFPPGGTSDILARSLGLRLTEQLGQQVVVETAPGPQARSAAKPRRVRRRMATRCC